MPEPPAWRFQKIIKPLFDYELGHTVLKGCVLTCKGFVKAPIHYQYPFLKKNYVGVVLVFFHAERAGSSESTSKVVRLRGVKLPI